MEQLILTVFVLTYFINKQVSQILQKWIGEHMDSVILEDFLCIHIEKERAGKSGRDMMCRQGNAGDGLLSRVC